MKTLTLGRTGLVVTKTAFGALPIQRAAPDEATRILKAAFEGGINYFDTANGYTDSEEKIGRALSDVREKIVISTKSFARDAGTVSKHIQLSLERMKTDYIDLFQLHNVDKLPDTGDPDDPYNAALEAKKRGYVRHIGVTTHKLPLAFELVRGGLFETMQFPFSHISDAGELELVRLCLDTDTGFIAMKGLAGGLLTNTRACHAFMAQFENVVPIWGIQTMDELNEWLAIAKEDPRMDGALQSAIDADRKALSGSFCRGCGYCLPCAADIPIHYAGRMDMLLRRAPWREFLSPEWREKMARIKDCTGCGICKTRCPYGLDTPEVLKRMLDDYEKFYELHRHEL